MRKQPLGETKGERKKRYSLAKGFIYYLTGLLTHAVLLLCSLIPERAFVYCVKRGAALYVFVVRRYRKRIAKNLKIAFGPSFRPEDIESLMKALGNHLGLSIAEMFYSASPKHKDLADRIRIQGAEHLEKALAMGKGVIAVSAHLGNFTLIGMKMLEEGYPCSMLVKDPKSKPLTNALRTLQKRQQGRFIYVEPWKEALREILARLRRNEIVCLITDEKKKRSGVEVDFFGRPAATALGPAIISLRTGSPVVPVFIVRNSDNTHTIHVEPAFVHPVTNNRNEHERALTAAFTKVIERYIRVYPEQWSWINNRWRRYDNLV